MIEPRFEPRGLDPEAAPLADFYKAGADHADAVNGSRRLRDAIVRLTKPEMKFQPRKRKRKDKPDCFRPRNHCSRQIAKAKVLNIRATVAEYFGLAVADMLTRRGAGKLPLYRQIAMHLSRELSTASYADIGVQFGGRDHTTVIHSCEAVKDLLEHDLRIRRDVAALVERLSA
jgi:hypothetical protein